MKCCHINIRKASFILLTIVVNRIQMADNLMDQLIKGQNNTRTDEEEKKPLDLVLHCPLSHEVECKHLNIPCIKCELNATCHYGTTISATCHKITEINCKGATKFQKKFICRYCYQTEHWEHTCDLKANCNSISSPRSTYITNCTVKDDILCLGHRTFNKNVKCNWTGGYRWTTALALSITLGGFGADRFYLGHWQEGIGKLFSFGGLGVWTIIDVILISLHYLGPADGSLYI
ncbi:TM2 domain-containing protein almondex [Anoplophora glabripennis]|uniref:TM2 domain-containing protein almondex n=1 Tax=Anoplophora glabripennis TaxID=217634 RepID=UPI000873B4CC|nr:TM2 domain-containing protein almondex [Anoplophora glabripennis]